MRSDLDAGLARYEKRLRRKAEEAMVQIMLLLENDIKAHHPYKDRSGDLTRSIQGMVVAVTLEYIQGNLTGNTSYAKIVNERDGGKFAYLTPAFARNADKIREIIRATFQ